MSNNVVPLRPADSPVPPTLPYPPSLPKGGALLRGRPLAVIHHAERWFQDQAEDKENHSSFIYAAGEMGGGELPFLFPS